MYKDFKSKLAVNNFKIFKICMIKAYKDNGLGIKAKIDLKTTKIDELSSAIYISHADYNLAIKYSFIYDKSSYLSALLYQKFSENLQCGSAIKLSSILAPDVKMCLQYKTENNKTYKLRVSNYGVFNLATNYKIND